MLKWTARAFALAATLQLGLASAQDAGDDVIPPAPNDAAAAERNLEEATDAPRDAVDETRDTVIDDAPSDAADAPRDVRRERRQAEEDAAERDAARDARQPRSQARPADSDQFGEELPPAAGGAEGIRISPQIEAATANLNIDDATRARYRFHNSEWWFKTKSGDWKFYREGSWQDFDPTTYQAPLLSGPGGSTVDRTYVPSQSYGTPTYGTPTYGSSRGYSYQPQSYSTPTPYRAYRPDYNTYDNRQYRDGRFYGGNRFDNQRYDGRYYQPGYGSGYGYQGYNPGNDRYYGQGAYGRPYSIDGDQYRGGVIGSEIGGRIGGNAGAIIGGAIGAEAAD